MSTDRTASDVLAFRAGALSLQRTFSGLAPIIRRTYLLSANAEVTSAHLGGAGASFGIIARELVYVVKELQKLIEELDLLFQRVARSSAGWLRAEQRERSLENTLRLIGQSDGDDAPVPVPVGGETAVLQIAQAPAAQGRLRPAHHQLSAALEASRLQVARDLGTVVAMVRRTGSLVNRLNWVAVRQCHFVAVTARIEAARAHEAGQGIAAVAGEIRQLADDIAHAELGARDGVLAVMAKVGTVTDTYGGLGLHAHTAVAAGAQ